MSHPVPSQPGPIADEAAVRSHKTLSDKIGGDQQVGTPGTPVWEADGNESVEFQRTANGLVNARHGLLVVPEPTAKTPAGGKSPSK